MSINLNLNTVSLSAQDLEQIQEAHEVLKGNSIGAPMEFLTDEEVTKLLPVCEKMKSLSLRQLILLTTGWAKALKGEYKYPHVTEDKKGRQVYQHCIYVSAARSFSPILGPHSGQGFSTIREWKIKHPAVLSFDVTVGGLDTSEVAQEIEGMEGNEALKYRVSLAMQKIHLEWKAPGEKQWNPYVVGACIPEGSSGYWIEYDLGVHTQGAPIQKRQFSFVVTEIPRVSPEDVSLIGKAESATQARVNIKVRGVWLAVSQAEKLAATLSKLCVDAMPEGSTESLEGTQLGGIVLYDAPTEGTLDEFVAKAMNEEVMPLPLPNVGMGQETAKGAPTYNPAAATLRALTGKHVLRNTYEVTQPVLMKNKQGVEVEKAFPVGDVVWDSDEFVMFRRAWSEATIREGVWARWIDEYMVDIMKSAIKYDKFEGTDKWESFPFRIVPAGDSPEDGYYYFHKADIRIELAPMTMETSTQLENLGTTPSGGMFWELQNVMGM